MQARLEGHGRLAGLLTSAVCFCVLLVLELPAQPPDLAAKSQQAAAAMRAKRFSEAAARYRELTAALPNHPELTMNLGLALHSSGQYAEAVNHFQSAVKLKPGLGPAWFFLGLDYQKLGEPGKAVEPLRRALELQPGNHVALLELADALRTLGRHDQAALRFRQLTEAQPANPKAWLGLGLTYASLSKDTADKLEKLAPESAYRYLLLAQSRADQKQYRSAFHYYRQALAKHPKLPGAHKALAGIYRETGHPGWAAQEEQKVNDAAVTCEQEPLRCRFLNRLYEEVVAAAEEVQNPTNLYWLAKAYAALASRAHGKLAGLPPSGELHQLMASIHDIELRHREAAQQWRKALEYRPGDRRIRVRLTRSLWSGRDYEPMIPLAEELLLQEGLKMSSSPEIHFLLGDALLNQQKIDKAIPHLESAASGDPEMLPARRSLASAYLRAGHEAKAIPHLRAALPSDEDGSLHYQLARAYQGTGEATKAKEIMRQYQELQRSAKVQESERGQQFQITAP